MTGNAGRKGDRGFGLQAFVPTPDHVSMAIGTDGRESQPLAALLWVGVLLKQ